MPEDPAVFGTGCIIVRVLVLVKHCNNEELSPLKYCYTLSLLLRWVFKKNITFFVLLCPQVLS